MQHSIRRRNPQSPDWLECTPLSSRQRGSCHLPTRSFSYSFPNCCCCSVTKLCLILCDPVDCSTPGFPDLHYLPGLLKFMFIGLVMLTHHLILCHLLLLLPSLSLSIRVFSSESVLYIRWPKYWSFSVSFSLSNEYAGLISFRIEWFDLLAIQWTLKSILQHHSLKASVLRCSVFFMVQLSHP